MEVQDYYKVLGVGRNATQFDVENAFEHFKTLHNSGQLSLLQWESIEEAYQVLSSVENRMLFDEVLKQNPSFDSPVINQAVPVINQSTIAKSQSNTTAAVVAIVIAAGGVLLAVIIGVFLIIASDESSQPQINSLNAGVQFTPTPSPTPKIILVTETPIVDLTGLELCQVTNASDTPIIIYGEMTEGSRLDAFFMLNQSLQVYRASSEAEWYQIAYDQIIEAGRTVTGSANALDVHGDYLRAEDVQLDFCSDASNEG